MPPTSTLPPETVDEPAPAPGSPPRRRVGRWVGIGALGLFAMLLVAEIGVRIIEDRLPAPNDHYNGGAQERADDMARLAGAGVTDELALVGTSMAFHGLLPQTFEDELDGDLQARNVSIPAAQTTVIDRWLRMVVLPQIHPKAVVWGVSTLDFNGGRPNPTIDVVNAARATRPGFRGDLDRWLSDHVMLIRHRETIRSPREVWHALREDQSPDDDRPLDELLQKEPEEVENKTDKELERVRDKVVGGFEVGDAEAEAFESTLDLFADEGIPVALVSMPVPAQYIDAHPDGQDDFDEWEAWIEGVAEEHGVLLLDHSDDYQTEDFLDHTHLRADAGEDLSTLIVDELHDNGFLDEAGLESSED